MSDASLTPEAKDLLLGLLEQSDPCLTGAAFEDFHPEEASMLLAVGLLERRGQVLSDAAGDYEDAPVALNWSPTHNSYGYFDRESGWIAVSAARATRYCVVIDKVAACLLGKPRGRAHQSRPLIPHLAWDLGEIRVPHRTHLVSVWLVRRACDAEVWTKIGRLAAERPPAHARVILATAEPIVLRADVPGNTSIIAIRDVMNGPGLVLDRAAVAARLDSAAPSLAVEPIQFIGDGRRIGLNGRIFVVKGTQQRRILRYLFERYQDGELQVSEEVVIADLDLPDGTRIRDYFKRCNPPLLGQLLTVHDRLWSFCLTPAEK